MKAIWKIARYVACALMGIGVVLSLAGFVLSGFDPRVFSASVDRGTVVFGGVVVENPDDLPLISTLAEMGRVEYGASFDEEQES